MYLSQEKDTLSDFRNLLQSRNYQEARLLLECTQEAFQSLSKTFVQGVNQLFIVLLISCQILKQTNKTSMNPGIPASVQE